MAIFLKDYFFALAAVGGAELGSRSEFSNINGMKYTDLCIAKVQHAACLLCIAASGLVLGASKDAAAKVGKQSILKGTNGRRVVGCFGCR